jgi:hypothetical protein
MAALILAAAVVADLTTMPTTKVVKAVQVLL